MSLSCFLLFILLFVLLCCLYFFFFVVVSRWWLDIAYKNLKYSFMYIVTTRRNGEGGGPYSHKELTVEEGIRTSSTSDDLAHFDTHVACLYANTYLGKTCQTQYTRYL